MNDLSHISSCLSLHHSQFLKMQDVAFMPAPALCGGQQGPGQAPWGLVPAAGRMRSASPGTVHVRGRVHKGQLVACTGLLGRGQHLLVKAGLRQRLSFQGLRQGLGKGLLGHWDGPRRAGPCFPPEVLRPH